MAVNNPRIPSHGKEAYAIGFMVGYLGEVPDDMVTAYDWEGEGCPPYLTTEQAREYREGYETGAAFWGDHSTDEEGE